MQGVYHLVCADFFEVLDIPVANDPRERGPDIGIVKVCPGIIQSLASSSYGKVYAVTVDISSRIAIPNISVFFIILPFLLLCLLFGNLGGMIMLIFNFRFVQLFLQL